VITPTTGWITRNSDNDERGYPGEIPGDILVYSLWLVSHIYQSTELKAKGLFYNKTGLLLLIELFRMLAGAGWQKITAHPGIDTAAITAWGAISRWVYI